jgi:dimethylamine/trimethylamine dehydrogenase
MVSQIRRGILDFVGAARPSIADPFLPEKIRADRSEDIRECIGCNVCASTEMYGVPIRCTQNPTIGEEWRKGWHPERIPARKRRETALVVGAGPAGLEAAVTLERRGVEVSLVDAGAELGGRIHWESRLPGMQTLGRVRDHRIHLLERSANVQIYRASRLTAGDILEYGAQRVVLATGSHWRSDGVGPASPAGLPGLGLAPPDWVSAPEAIIARLLADGPLPPSAVVYDDDHYYLGHSIAEMLRARGLEVTLVTPLSEISQWSYYTLEQKRIEERLAGAGIRCLTKARVTGMRGRRLDLSVGGEPLSLEAGCLVPVTLRTPGDGLMQDLVARESEWRDAGVLSVDLIGDAEAPGTVAAAVYAGARAGRELDAEERAPFLRERVVLR